MRPKEIMSEPHTASTQDEDHTATHQNPKQLLVAVFFSFVIPVFIIIGLVYFVNSGNKPAAGAVNTRKGRGRTYSKGSGHRHTGCQPRNEVRPRRVQVAVRRLP